MLHLTLSGIGLYVCRKSAGGYYWRNLLGTEHGDVGLPWQECTRMSVRDSVLW